MLRGPYRRLAYALIFSNTVCLLLFAIRVWGADSFRFGFLFWNLMLAWVPLALVIWLTRTLRDHSWASWQAVLLTILWLGFLPNSFYVATDLIHLHLTGEINILFDVVFLLSCIFNAYAFGFMSLYVVHRQLLARLRPWKAHLLVAAVLLTCSFAIYLGRYLRWNTWDALVHPLALLFDVSSRIVNPVAHPQVFSTTASFFLLLTSAYWVIFELAGVLRRSQRR